MVARSAQWSFGPSGRRSKSLITQNDPGFRPGTPRERLEDMDRDGIHAHVVYGPPLSLPIPDLEVRAACLRGSYNDWAADFNRAEPNRLVVLAFLPSHTPRAATAELHGVAALGHRGAIVDFLAGDDPAFEDSWERFWATANELAIPISFHLARACTAFRSSPEVGGWLPVSRCHRCSSTK